MSGVSNFLRKEVGNINFARQVGDGNVPSFNVISNGYFSDVEVSKSFRYIDPITPIAATSIVVDGVMYTTSSWSIVVALDARTGKPL